MYIFKSLVRILTSSHQNYFYPYEFILGVYDGIRTIQKPVGLFFNPPYRRHGYTLLLLSVLSTHPVAAATDCLTQNDIPATECQALVDLYKRTQGPQWFDAHQWNLNQTPCQWQGIVCLQGHVSVINRSQHNLTGQLPELKALTQLKRLNLSDNHLIGPIPELTSLTQLQELYLNHNQLSGQIATLTASTQLQWVDISNNNLSGRLPELSALPQLQFFNAASNQFSGQIPALTGLNQLQVFSLADNQLTGSIPALNHLVQLQELRLSFNQLAGPMPTLSALTALQHLYLDHNQLSGSVPALNPLIQLKVLQLSHNQLQGPLPALPAALQALWLDDNQFQGPVPQLNHLTQLQQLHLDHNALTGALPALTSLRQLHVLSIDNNQLSGTIPDLSGLNQLTQLHLAHNQFSGPLPALNPLTQLRELRLDHNQLSGPIPDINALVHLQELGLANNLLSGEIHKSVSQLPQLISGELHLGYNKLTAHDPSLIEFLNQKASDWNQTQTVPPSDIYTTVLSEQRIQLHWQPIPYADGEGYYQIRYATHSGGPYQKVATTDKRTEHYTLSDLSPHTTYFFTLETHSIIADKHLISTPSQVVSATTTLAEPLLHSQPAMNTTIDLGHSVVNQPITTTLTLLNAGQQTITVSKAHISGPQAAEFSLTQTTPPLTLAEHSQHTQTLQCLPQAVGLRQATLTVFTDIPPTLTYPLTCTGVTEMAHMSGEIQTQAGAQGEQLYIDAPERITLMGMIEPPASHLGQQADIMVTYEWLPAAGGDPILLPIRFAEDVVLERAMAFTLLEHYLLLHLAGTFHVNLGYQLTANQQYSADIVTLHVRPNRAPVNLRLQGHQVKENSPAGTLIGRLVTIDHDQGDWFAYGIVNKSAQKYFTVVDNQLQVASRLDFETATTHVVTLSSTDASGGIIEKNFTIELIDEQAVLNDIGLTQQHVPENSPAGLVVAKVFTEADEPGTYQYQLIDDAEGHFKLIDDMLVVAQAAQLDYETQAEYAITVQSQDINSQTVIDKRFTLELLNLIDVALTGEVSNAQGHLIEPPSLNNREKATVSVHVFPDIEHYGQDAELICVALYHQHDTTLAAYQLAGHQHWQLWNGDLATLTAIQAVTLEKSHEINLLQGQFGGFAGGELNIYGGYRLMESGEIVYSLTSFDIEIQ